MVVQHEKTAKKLLSYTRGVNVYVFHVSHTDFHWFDWLTDVRGNPYGFTITKIYILHFFFFFTTRDLLIWRLHEW